MAATTFKIHSFRRPGIPRWKQYAELVVGKTELVSLLRYELITGVLGNLPGAVGLYLRSKYYPWILGAVGSNVVFGRGITLRHPHKISIGNNVVIDDHCMLDAKGRTNGGITIGDGVFIGRNSIVYCKDGDIDIQPRVNISFNCEVFSSLRVVIGRGTLIAAYCFVMSGGTYTYGESDVAFVDQEGCAKGPTVIGEGCWLGARVTVLDGVSIGSRTVLGAGAVITKDLPDRVVAVGVPATVLHKRTIIHSDRGDELGTDAEMVRAGTESA